MKKMMFMKKYLLYAYVFVISILGLALLVLDKFEYQNELLDILLYILCTLLLVGIIFMFIDVRKKRIRPSVFVLTLASVGLVGYFPFMTDILCYVFLGIIFTLLLIGIIFEVVCDVREGKISLSRQTIIMFMKKNLPYVVVTLILTLALFVLGRYLLPFISWKSGTIHTLDKLLGILFCVACTFIGLCLIFTVVHKWRVGHGAPIIKNAWLFSISFLLSSLLLKQYFEGNFETQYTIFKGGPSQDIVETEIWGNGFVNHNAYYDRLGRLKCWADDYGTLRSNGNGKKIYAVYDAEGKKRVVVVRSELIDPKLELPIQHIGTNCPKDSNYDNYTNNCYQEWVSELSLSQEYDEWGNLVDSGSQRTSRYKIHYYPNNDFAYPFKDSNNDRYISHYRYEEELKFQFIESLGYTLSDNYLSEREIIKKCIYLD